MCKEGSLVPNYTNHLNFYISIIPVKIMKYLDKISHNAKSLPRNSLLALVIGFTSFCCPHTILPPKPNPPDFNYVGVNYGDWTAGSYPYTISWKPETFPDSQGITNVDITTEHHYQGKVH